MVNPLMFNSSDSNAVIPVEPECQIQTQELEDGKFVTVFSQLEKDNTPHSFRDCDIQVIVDAGLFDKLALGKPVQITLLDKQDQIFDGAEAINRLDIESQVMQRREELDKEFADKFALNDQQQQQDQVQSESAKK